MKTICKAFGLFCLVTAVSACGPKNSLKMNQEIIDVGNLTDNQSVYPVLKIYNSSSKDIVVDSVRVSTRNIGIMTTPQVLTAKDTSLLEFALMTSFMDGEFAGLVEVYVAGDKEPMEAIIKGNVKATPKAVEEICTYPLCQMMISERKIDLGNVPVGKEVTDTIWIYNPTRKMVSVTHVGLVQNIKATPIDRVVKPGKGTPIVISAKFNDIERLGRMGEVLTLDVGESRCRDNTLVVEANVVESFDHLTKEELAAAPEVEVDKSEHDFGDVKEGEKLVHKFKLTNKGKTPLVIRAVNTTCGCTIAKLSKKVVAPNETIELETLYDMKGRRGTQQKSITVVTNSPTSQYIKLWLTANVVK